MTDAGRWIAAALLAAAVSACAPSSANPTPPPGANVAPTFATADAPLTTISSLATSLRVVALVFDLGDDAGHTAEILDVLRREHVRATFIVTGYWAEQHHELLLAMTASGHQIVNGTYHGTSFTGASTGTLPLTAGERTLELSRTEVTVYHLTQRSTRPYWHPPYGDIDAGGQRDAAAAGYPIAVMPAFDTAAAGDLSADAIAARTVAEAAPGAIVLMHAASASQDAAALQAISAGLRAAGYAFATIADEISAP